MHTPILGLHHVTATVDDAQPDLDFCAGLLGLRLVKQTVNFDNHHVFHFYYGDDRGTPGTIWTTFPYHGRNVRVGTKGAGQITATSFSVPDGSLGAWIARLRERGFDVAAEGARFGQASLLVADPSGLAIELIESTGDTRRGWPGAGIDAAHAVRGLHSVTLSVRAPEATTRFLHEVLGFETVDEVEGRTRLAVNGNLPGRWLEILHSPDAPPAVNGLGTVHHVALAISGDDEQRRLRQDLVDRGVQVTEIRDRQYFRSIYFREPGGVLLEVATMQPGFTADEPLDRLGQALKLPPWEEPHRADIEAHLPAIQVPVA
jgi:glyoxalase family protein